MTSDRNREVRRWKSRPGCQSRHPPPVRPAELLALDDALDRLSLVDRRRAQVVEHRIFAGLSTAETATLLGVSTGTVERDWRAARAWLSTEIAEADRPDAAAYGG